MQERVKAVRSPWAAPAMSTMCTKDASTAIWRVSGNAAFVRGMLATLKGSPATQEQV